MLGKIWNFIKKNWYWIFLPVGIFYFLWRTLQPKQISVFPPDSGSEETAKVVIRANETAAKIESAEKATEEQIKRIEVSHKATLDKLTQDQKKTYEDLKKKPAQEITDWLLSVGKGDK